MPKLYRVEMYVLDINDMYNDLDDILELAGERMDIDFTPFNVEEVWFEWDDYIDLNYEDAEIDTYRNYFKED